MNTTPVVPERWLADADYEQIRPHLPPDLPPIPEIPQRCDGASLAQVRIGASEDPLVELPPFLPQEHLYLRLNSPVMPQKMYARKGMIDRLDAAQQLLPPGFHLCCLDTWRSMAAQQELIRIYQQAFPANSKNYIAATNNPAILPPHTTGGAVDVTLSFQRTPLALGTDFDAFLPESHARSLEHIADTDEPEKVVARDLRRLLSHCLLSVGFAPFDKEWWHYSYGDQRWAAYYSRGVSLYGLATPHETSQ
ncbi:hypothetical protein GP475_02160 [Corynebacterium poyangense]|uniref:D-Ala-D-Ala dipeptidase n=1 Tax=Corynebacterium poyangense TaxID=2684405 RepID=A0A7H0SLZ3_9CORY|nr:M15 family metallopeptidase [Corynebacterium poyangense]QNQ89568.1 hypothetical protein GP475_02160 [Corynebacterium poyangense]